MIKDWWKQNSRIISVITDNSNNWFIPYAEKLCKQIDLIGDNSRLYTNQNIIEEGDIAFYLSCTKLTSQETLAKHKVNLVVHESDLPKGKGFSPVTWQILEGKKTIPICLIEMVEDLDAGPIIFKDLMIFNGSELCNEIKHQQAEATIELCLKYLTAPSQPHGTAQSGQESFYKRRSPKDSELNLDISLSEQIDLLRVCDNENYPAFFIYKNQKYILKIEKADLSASKEILRFKITE